MMLFQAAIEAMGFVPISEASPIEASFHSLHVFEVCGFTMPQAGVFTVRASASGIDYDMGIGGRGPGSSLAIAHLFCWPGDCSVVKVLHHYILLF